MKVNKDLPEFVMTGRKGLIMSGASLWPMKMLAAATRLSPAVVRITFPITHATFLMTYTIKPVWNSRPTKELRGGKREISFF